MPPAVSDEEDVAPATFVDQEDDSENEIPAQAPKTISQEVAMEDAQDADEDEDEGEEDGEDEEYLVEKILDHKGKGKKFEYLVKWQGYDAVEDQTWEPEFPNLENAKDIVAAYWKSKGGRPGEASTSKSTSAAATKKRKQSLNATSSTPASTDKKASKRARNSLRPASSNATPEIQPSRKRGDMPQGSWEDAVDSIDTLSQVEDPATGKKTITAKCVMADGMDPRYVEIGVDRLRVKAPQKLLDYLFAHLSFREAPETNGDRYKAEDED